MNYVWNYVLISWLLVKFLVLSLISPHLDPNEVTIPISSPSIQLACDNDLRVNNIDVTIRRSNTTCLTTIPECTLPNEAIETIEEKCNKQVSCDVDIRNITNNHSCLHEFGYFNVWYTCKTIIDYSCDFESNLCNWSFVPDNYGFQWKHGRRWSYQPPYVDHSSASRAGKYVYIYTPIYGSSEGDIAKLESGHIIATEQQCLSFWYFTTNSRDSVHVFQNEDNLLNLTYNYEERIWNHIQIPLEKKSHDSFKLVFKVIRGNPKDGSYGAIVIDDILIENQNCDSYILNCDFETNSCDLKTDEQNQYVWQKQHGQPTFDNTGPSTDHSTASESGYYMYLGSRTDAIGSEIRTAYFAFQKVELHEPGNCCLTFWYHMYRDTYGMEELNVELNDEIVWTEYGKRDNQHDQWKKGTIDLHNTKNIDIKFIGILGSSSLDDIAIDDIVLTNGTCKGLFHHEETCVHSDNKIPKVTSCPKDYLDLQNPSLSFDPEREDCFDIYDQIKTRLLGDCKNVNDSQKCLIDPSTDISSQPECFQLYDFRILYTCEDEKTATVSSDNSSGDSSAAVETTTVLSFTTSREDSAVETTTVLSFTTSREDSSSVSDESVPLPRLMGNSSDSATGLVVGFIIGTLLLVCVVIVIVILIRRHTFKSNPRENIRNNLGGNDYIGSQDIALPLTANHSSHMQNDGMYEQSRNTFVHDYDSIHPNAQINNIQHECTNLGALNGFVNKEKVQIPTYADRQDKTLTDNHMSNDDEYAIVDPTAETSFKESIYNRTGNGDSYMVLDPTETGFNRQIFSKTPTGYESAKPVKDTENKICDEDQYDISDEGVYDHSGSNRHKESENNIYNHAVDTIYDSGSHKRNDEGREDTYDHFFGQKTEDGYDVSTTT